MDNLDTLSDKAYSEFYSERDFAHVWFRSYFSVHNIVLHFCFVALAIIASSIVKFSFPFNFRNYIEMFSDILLTYSSTIIGFLLVSFSILLSISNVRNHFTYFVKINKIYNRPLLKVILDHFIFPIGVFLLLLILSLMIKLFNGFCFFSHLNLSYKTHIFRLLIGGYSFLVLLSISELVSYFFNMYQFIVITSFTISKEYEESILERLYVKKEKIDILNIDDAKQIVDYQEKKKMQENT